MKIRNMLSVVAAMAIAFAGGAYTMAQVHDWHDVDRVHHHVLDALHELQKARQANYYNMGGHGERAEQFLVQAEHELDLAVQYAQTH